MLLVSALLALANLIQCVPHTFNQLPISTSDLISASTIREILLENSIIDEVLDDFEPLYYLDVSYPKHHETVLLGNDLPVKSVSNRPVFTFHPLVSLGRAAKNSTFTLILTDPDATSREDPKMSEMCHWIITNLTTPIHNPPLLDIRKSKKLSGELESYYAPAPPPKTGPHRYVFVLLDGEHVNITTPKKRPHWGYGKVRHGVRDWAAENNLTVVGANFFFAQNKKQ